MAKLSEKHVQVLKRQHYEIVGKHSAVEICHWTKKSLLDRGVCYKQKFYGIESHRCCQMSPATGFCNQKCIFCWRAHELNEGTSMNSDVDNPEGIIDGCIRAQVRKLSGFKGNKDVNMKRWKEAQEPNQFAISLTGEPTLYPKLSGLIKELRRRKKTSFLVTNGTRPEMLMRLKEEKALPTQLYVSLDAPNEKMHKKINIPLDKSDWKKLNKTLKLLPKLDCRKVIRITLIKSLNDCCIPEYAELVRKAGNVMLEVKAYMYLGHSRKRLKLENTPAHREVKRFSKDLAKGLGWKIIDESKPSRVVLIAKRDFSGRTMK